MTDLDKLPGRDTEPEERDSRSGLHALTVHSPGLDAQLFGWAGRVGLRRHYQWLVLPCDEDPGRMAILAAMIQRHPSPEQGWLVRSRSGTALIPGHHKRVPKGAEEVQVVRAGLFPLGRKWQPFEDWFCWDGEGVVWANDMASRALDMMRTRQELARYAAEALVTARTSANPVTRLHTSWT